MASTANNDYVASICESTARQKLKPTALSLLYSFAACSAYSAALRAATLLQIIKNGRGGGGEGEEGLRNLSSLMFAGQMRLMKGHQAGEEGTEQALTQCTPPWPSPSPCLQGRVGGETHEGRRRMGKSEKPRAAAAH